MSEISVIICTHNPRTDYLTKTLSALKNQTLPKDQWDLLIVDNASNCTLDDQCDLSFHPRAKILRENQLGLTYARLRGIQETEAPLLVFVDDDNVLNPDYLEEALNLSREWPLLGAFGGQVRPCFEEKPAEWTKAFWHMLALREVEEDRWSNVPRQLDTTPIGAGLIIRRQVATAYVEDLDRNPERIKLDRKGAQLSSYGDIDLAFTAVDIGLGMGVFSRLGLTHLISGNRVSEAYLLRLVEWNNFSWMILGTIRGMGVIPHRRSFLTKLHEWGHLMRLTPRERRFELAARKGVARAEKVLASNSHNGRGAAR